DPSVRTAALRPACRQLLSPESVAGGTMPEKRTTGRAAAKFKRDISRTVDNLEQQMARRVASAKQWGEVKGDLKAADRATKMVVRSFFFDFEAEVDAERRLPPHGPDYDQNVWLVAAARALGSDVIHSPTFRSELLSVCFQRQVHVADVE